MKRVGGQGPALLVFPRLQAAGLICAVSTVPLNIKEEPDQRRFLRAAGADPERVSTTTQVHHAKVAVASEARPQADGLVTDEAGRALLLRAADCSLVVVADPARRALGVAHAGWKGSARGVVVNLVRALQERYGSEPSACLAAVGPTISAARYEVGPEVVTAFLRARTWTREYVHARAGALHLDLAGINTRFLIECGLEPEAIEGADLCTYDHPDLLHSFRREGAGAGHHGLVAAWPA